MKNRPAWVTSARPSGSSISAKVETTGGDTIVKIEWRNVTATGAPATDSLNFQAWLYKKSQTIEFHYGPCNNSATFDTAVINTSLLSIDFNTNYESHSIVGIPATASDDKVVNTPNVLVGTIANGTVYSFTSSTTGIKKVAADRPVIYPNPVGNTLFVELKSAGKAPYIVYDVLGKPVLNGELSHYATIDVSSLSPGAYTITIGNEVQKFIHE